jgi:hypothetical protein
MEDTMKPNYLLLFCAALVILISLAACRQQPATNPPAVETSLASTARALAKQTESANPTVTPSPTSTEMPTRTPRISTGGTSLEIREDGSTLFTDHKLGYQLMIPADWLAIRINEDEYYKAFTVEEVAANPVMVDFLSKIQTQDSNQVRMFALDLRAAGGSISGISVVLQPPTIETMDDWVVARISRGNKKPGYILHSSGYQEIPAGVRAMVRDEQWNSTSSGKIYSRTIALIVPAGILTIDFETALENKDTLLPDFEQVVNSIILLNP